MRMQISNFFVAMATTVALACAMGIARDAMANDRPLFATRQAAADAALAARAVFRRDTPEALLLDSRVGRMFAARRLEEEVRYCARLSILPVVAKMEDGELRNIASR